MCKYTSEFITVCPQNTFGRDRCYYHQKVEDGHIEPEEGDYRY